MLSAVDLGFYSCFILFIWNIHRFFIKDTVFKTSFTFTYIFVNRISVGHGTRIMVSLPMLGLGQSVKWIALVNLWTFTKIAHHTVIKAHMSITQEAVLHIINTAFVGVDSTNSNNMQDIQQTNKQIYKIYIITRYVTMQHTLQTAKL